LLDECDIIAKSRISKNDVGEMARIVNILLTLLDEYKADGMIIATTNLEDHLDKALYRRFDDIVELSKPARKEVEKLLKFYVSGIGVSKEIDWDKLLTKLE
jgi:AAA+ superfamily predicted ATPase